MVRIVSHILARTGNTAPFCPQLQALMSDVEHVAAHADPNTATREQLIQGVVVEVCSELCECDDGWCVVCGVCVCVCVVCSVSLICCSVHRCTCPFVSFTLQTKIIQSLYMTQAFYADMQYRKTTTAAAADNPNIQTTLTSLSVYQHAYDRACSQLLSLEAHPEATIAFEQPPKLPQNALQAADAKRKASEADASGEQAPKRPPASHTEADASLAFLADASLLSESRLGPDSKDAHVHP